MADASPETAPGWAAAEIDGLHDEALMAMVAGGDRVAFRVLVGRHLARVVAIAERVLGNREDAEDVAQEVFHKVWVGAPNWQSGLARLTTWLYRVTVNLAIDRRRKPRAEPLESAPEPADERDDAYRTIARDQTARRVRAAIDGLPERQRTALILCWYEGLSNIDAAAAMEISVHAIESLLVRARRSLKLELAGLEEDLVR